MKFSRDESDSSANAWTAGAFNLPGLVSIIGYKLTAYIGGVSSTQSVGDWLRNGLPAVLEPRMKAAFDVVRPIAEVESEFTAQDFLMQGWEETGKYHTPARMLREADAEAARQLLTRLVTTEFLSNEVGDLADIAVRLQEWISQAEFPERVGYTCTMWQGRRLSLVLIHSGFPEAVQREWDRGIDWPRWDQVIAAVPEMESARLPVVPQAELLHAKIGAQLQQVIASGLCAPGILRPTGGVYSYLFADPLQ